jgi:hypothetical protein
MGFVACLFVSRVRAIYRGGTKKFNLGGWQNYLDFFGCGNFYNL